VRVGPHQGPPPASSMGKGQRSCHHSIGARHACPMPGREAAARGHDVVAGRPAERSDPGGADRGAAGLCWAAARCGLDASSLAASASPAGRGASQVERGVGSGARRPPAALPALRWHTDRKGPLAAPPRVTDPLAGGCGFWPHSDAGGGARKVARGRKLVSRVPGALGARSPCGSRTPGRRYSTRER